MIKDNAGLGKSEQRRLAREKRGLLQDAFRGEAADEIARIGIAFCEPRVGAVVAGYSAIGSEIDPAALITRLSGEGFQTALSVTPDAAYPLEFRTWRPGEPLDAGPMGIGQPPASAPVVRPDVLLVPLLAFNAAGYRLGYGGGYYDRTLEVSRRDRTVIAIGLAFDQQETDDLAVDPWDQPLDWLLTPSGPRRFPLRASDR